MIAVAIMVGVDDNETSSLWLHTVAALDGANMVAEILAKQAALESFF